MAKKKSAPSSANTASRKKASSPKPKAADGCLSRDQVYDAAFREVLARGASHRDAQRVAESVADRLRVGCSVSNLSNADEDDFYDLRHEQDYDYPRGAKKARMKGLSPVRRDPSTIDTIVVHQTGVEYGVSSQQVKLADGDSNLALARRALDIASHTVAFRRGFFVASHPLDVYLNAANRLNPRSCSLEIDGRYPGLSDDPTTLEREDLLTTWKGTPTELTDATVDAACRALKWMCEEGRRVGIHFTRIAPHRISSDTRRSDPGEAIWRRVVLDYAEPELGLEVVRESPWRQGRDVPVEWDPNGIGEY